MKKRKIMPQRVEYKNAIRSKKLIRSAFIELLKVKPLDKITVTNIVERAELNRGTFYAHYTDINMLIQSIEDEIADSLYKLLDDAENTNPLENPLSMFLKISRYLEQNKELIIVLMGSQSTNPFIVQLPELIARHLVSSEDIDEEVRSSASFKERCYFYAGGAGSLYMAWFRGTVSGSLESVAYRLADIIRQG